MSSSASSTLRRAAAMALALAAALSYGWVLADVRPFTRPAEALTALPIVVVAIALVSTRVRTAHADSRPGWGLAVWGVLLLAFVGWELRELFASPRHDYPTVSSIGNRVLNSSRMVIAVAFTVWVALGWRIVRRWPSRGDR
jgi:hypothetical protein